MEQTLYLGSDHAGFELKQKIKQQLSSNYHIIDCGPSEYDQKDDYPHFAQLVARSIIRNPDAKGILVCDTGVGMSMAANRFRGIRAALVTSQFLAQRSRLHEDANILCLGSDAITEEENMEVIHRWLETPFSNEERHKRRIGMLDIIS